MSEYQNREIRTTSFMGEEVDFIASNDRLQERVQNLSYERDVLQALVTAINPDDVVWDIGACLGIHTFILAKHLKDGEVIGFEPMPNNRGVLIDNQSINELENVLVEKCALADENGEADFAIRQSFEAGFGRHSLTTGRDAYEKEATITVPTWRGTELADESNLPVPNVVKIDVEGAGPLVLQGMKDLLEQEALHTVIFETHEPNDVQPSHEDFGWTREDIIEFLEGCGFHVDTLEEDFHLIAEKTPSSVISFTESALDVELVQGDIAAESVDAIVNSSGTTLRMGTGVAGALRDAGGESIHREAIQEGPVDVGDAVATKAGDLDAGFVIHAASMPHHGDGKSTPESVRRAVSEALDRADELGCTTIALPAVGCGLGGVSLATGAQVIGETLRDFEPEYDSLDEVRFVTYTDDEYWTVKNILDA